MKRIDVSAIPEIGSEPRGINEKYWVNHGGIKKLVKFNSELYPDLDIMEKIAEEILKKMGIECVDIELGSDENKNNCCLVTSFLNKKSEILQEIDFNWFNRQDSDVNRNIQMCFGKVFGIFYKLRDIDDEQLNRLIKQYIRKTLGDCIIGNEDGKLKNTGIIYDENEHKYYLTPSFDNGLAFNSYLCNDYAAICHIGNQAFDAFDVIDYIVTRNYDQVKDIIDNFLTFMEDDYLEIIDKYKDELDEDKYYHIINYLQIVKEEINKLINTKSGKVKQKTK